MTVISAAAWSGLVVCLDSTGALATPSVGPVGTLYVDGVANGASVTVTGSNPYKWTVTLPTLTAGQVVSMYITATIATIATAAVVAEEVADTTYVSGVDTEVWSATTRTLTQAASSIAAIVTGTALTIHRGDTTTISLTALGDISTRTKLWFAVKDSTVDADASSILFVEETAGLTVVNGAAYTTVAHGAITVTDDVTGALSIVINAAVTAQLVPDMQYKWDIQMLTASGVTTLTQGDAMVTADITRTTA